MSKTNRPQPVVSSSNNAVTVNPLATPATAGQTDKENSQVTAQTAQTAEAPAPFGAPFGATFAKADAAGKVIIPQPAPDAADAWAEYEELLAAASAAKSPIVAKSHKDSAAALVDATPALAAYLQERRDATLAPARAALFAAFAHYCDAAGLDKTRLYSITHDAIAAAATVAPVATGKKLAGGNVGKDNPLVVGETAYRFITTRKDGKNVATAALAAVKRVSDKAYRVTTATRDDDDNLIIALLPDTYTSGSGANTAAAKATSALTADGADIGYNQLWRMDATAPGTPKNVAAQMRRLADAMPK